MAKCDVAGCDNEATYHWQLRIDPPLYDATQRKYAADLCPMHQHQMTQDAWVLFDAMQWRNQGERVL